MFLSFFEFDALNRVEDTEFIDDLLLGGEGEDLLIGFETCDDFGEFSAVGEDDNALGV